MLINLIDYSKSDNPIWTGL